MPVVNERQRQTYFGALNYRTKEFVAKAYAKGNSEHTVEFLQALQAQCPRQRLAIFWDGPSYHRSAELKAYLQSVNGDLPEHARHVTCTRFAERFADRASARKSLIPMRPNRIRSRIFGYRRNASFASGTICANPLLSLNSCLS